MTDDHDADVLVVEDSPTDAELTLRALARQGPAPCLRWVQDGVEALDWLARAARPPRMLLLDLKLPRRDGIAVLDAVRADPRTRDMPVVMLTSSGERRDVAECYRHGASSYIVKPAAVERYLEVVARAGEYWLRINHPPL